jgi:hypothetical protein
MYPNIGIGFWDKNILDLLIRHKIINEYKSLCINCNYPIDGKSFSIRLLEELDLSIVLSTMECMQINQVIGIFICAIDGGLRLDILEEFFSLLPGNSIFLNTGQYDLANWILEDSSYNFNKIDIETTMMLLGKINCTVGNYTSTGKLSDIIIKIIRQDDNNYLLRLILNEKKNFNVTNKHLKEAIEFQRLEIVRYLITAKGMSLGPDDYCLLLRLISAQKHSIWIQHLTNRIDNSQDLLDFIRMLTECYDSGFIPEWKIWWPRIVELMHKVHKIDLNGLNDPVFEAMSI